MQRKQKIIVIKFVLIIIFSFALVIGMIHFKDHVNRVEAERVMHALSERVSQYRQENGYVPNQQYVDQLYQNIIGSARLPRVDYRARWLEYDSDPNTILIYTLKRYPISILPDGYIYSTLAGEVHWMEKEEFEKLLDSQQSEAEKELAPLVR